MTSDGNAKLVLTLGFEVVPLKSDILIVSPSTLVFKVPVNLKFVQELSLVLKESDCGFCNTPELPSVAPSSNISPAPVPPSR